MEQYLQRLPLLLFSVFTLKLMTNNNWSYENAFVLLVLGILCCSCEMNLRFKEAKELRALIAAQDEEIKKIKAFQEHVSSSITSLRMASNVKQTAGQIKF